MVTRGLSGWLLFVAMATSSPLQAVMYSWLPWLHTCGSQGDGREEIRDEGEEERFILVNQLRQVHVTQHSHHCAGD